MADRFKQVAVLMGGPSDEREVSLRSGTAVARGLRAAGYTVAEVDPADGQLRLAADIEAVFVALHGAFGEDGTVQTLLQQRGLPYTGSGAAASRTAFDKRLSKCVFARQGIPSPEYEVLRAGGRRTLPLPVVVKPVRQGSSIGLHRVFAEADWAPALADAVRYNGSALVERFIDGRELTVGLVGTEALPVLEIRAPGGCYDFKAKYTPGLTDYLVPAPLAEETACACQDLARRVFAALEARDVGRVDLRLTPAGELFVLELNTIPGFTETSLLPKAARAAGLEFSELCDRIMRRATVH